MRTQGTAYPASRAVEPRALRHKGAASRPKVGADAARTPLLLRARVLMTRGRLDRQISTGGPCEANEALALRTSQLTDPTSQRRIAANLRRVVAYAERHRARALTSAVLIEPRSVREGRDAILGLAEWLERGEPVSPRGILLAQRLLTDGVSPLFDSACERSVVQAVCEIQDALAQPAKRSTVPESPLLRRRE
jgi:hypothetical protein